MANIYRVLDYYEDCLFRVENKIYCKASFDGFYHIYNYDNYLLSDNLDNLISHIQSGNTTYSNWISCSKDFILDVEKYTVSKLYAQKVLRPNVAVIQNHCESSLILKDKNIDIFKLFKELPSNYELSLKIPSLINEIREKPISQIEKLVINSDDNILLQRLFHCGLIRTKNGRIPNIDSRAFNYARSSSENLVLSKIENKNLYEQNVPLILKPFEYDILYTLIKNGSLKSDLSTSAIKYITFTLKRFPLSNLNKVERAFYSWHYSSNYSLEYILDCYDDKRLDIISLYLELLKLKKSILKQVINWMNKEFNYNYNNQIYLVDDNSYVLRSKGPYQKINAELYNGINIEVNPLNETECKYITDDITDKISFISSCDDNEEFYTVINGRIYRAPLYKYDKVKKYIKNIGNR